MKTTNNKSIFLLFSHKLTKPQIDELKRIGVNRYVYLDNDLQQIWSFVPTQEVNLKEYLKPIFEFLVNNAKKGDYVLVQGDFGATYLTVDFCFEHNLIPIYAVSKRVAYEKIEDGEVIKVSRFKHEGFRKYMRWRDGFGGGAG